MERLAHYIFANDREEADVLAGMFERDGIPVRWSRHRPGSFIELEVGAPLVAPLALDE